MFFSELWLWRNFVTTFSIIFVFVYRFVSANWRRMNFLFFFSTTLCICYLNFNIIFVSVMFFLRNIMKVVSSSLFSSTSFSLLLIIIALIVFLDVHSIPSSPYMANINEFCKNNDELSFAMCRRWYKNLFMQSALIIRWIALRCALCTLHSACSCWKKRIRWNRERIRKNKKLHCSINNKKDRRSSSLCFLSFLLQLGCCKLIVAALSV